jgi:hypothetical protein
MTIPNTYRAAEGLTVEGASPELLRDLLQQYESDIRKAGVRTKDVLLPGLSEREIRRQFGDIGIEPPEELLVWWGWHNGINQRYTGATRFNFLPLEAAIATYSSDPHGTDIHSWNPQWIRVADYSAGIAVKCENRTIPPLVRYVSAWTSGTQDDETEAQVVSLCTPVSWWLLAIEKGWAKFQPGVGPGGGGQWTQTIRAFPFEWDLTALG